MSVTLVDTITYKKLVTAANSKLYYEASVGTMTELSTASYTIDTTDQLNMFEAFQKVFVVNGSKLGVADFINTKISTSDIAPTDKSAPIKGTLLTYDGDPDATMVVDYVTAADGAADIYGYVTSGTIPSTAVVLTGTNESGTPTAVSFTKTAVAPVSNPHWYQWTVYPSASGTDFGIMPVKAYLGCLYRGRGVLSGNPNAPNQWYMSRIANLYDWDYSATDAMSAVAGQDADAGELGDIIRALVPYKDDILIFGCATSMWYLRGDPMSGGSIDSFDLTIGIFGANSWCIDGEGSFYFWGSGGIYRSSIEGGVISKPSLITGILLPNIIKDTAADPSTHRICMGYDRKRLGIVITITKLSDGTSSNWWYDLRTQGFFPESYPTASGAYSLFNYQANSDTYSGLLLGCKDGYVRKFNDSLKGDNATADNPGVGTTAINSYVGMVQQIGDGEDREGKLNSLTITTAGGASGGGFADTDSVSFEISKGNNAETVWEDMIDGATAQETGSIITTGRQNRVRKKVRGVYLGLKFYNSTVSKTWALEKITAEVVPAGKVK
jgi:hypothetical protein